MIITTIKAYNYFAYKVGSPINTEAVLPYSVCMVIICCGLGLYNKMQNKKINNISTILKIESKTNIIDGLQSLGIGIAVMLLYFVDINGKLGFLHYTGDFFMTSVLVLFSIKEPIKVLIDAFKELTYGTINDSVIGKNIGGVIDNNLDSILENKKYDIFKIGTKVKVRITILDILDNEIINKIVISRDRIVEILKGEYEDIEVIFIF